MEAELARHAWVHFDCHGTQDLDNPFRGGLVLHNQTLTVANLAGVRRDHGEFAFLAACKTAVGGIRVPDEAITLTTALHDAVRAERMRFPESPNSPNLPRSPRVGLP